MNGQIWELKFFTPAPNQSEMQKSPDDMWIHHLPIFRNAPCLRASILDQGILEGESLVADILSSRMEASYCTSGFFVVRPANLELPFPRVLKSRTHNRHIGYRALNLAETIMCANRAEWSPNPKVRYLTSMRNGQYGRRPIALTQGSKRYPIPPLKSFAHDACLRSIQTKVLCNWPEDPGYWPPPPSRSIMKYVQKVNG